MSRSVPLDGASCRETRDSPRGARIELRHMHIRSRQVAGMGFEMREGRWRDSMES